jgi:cytochrome c553
MKYFGLLLSIGLLHGFTSTGISAEALYFEQPVRAIFKAHCFQCHGEEGSPKGKLDLRLRRFMVLGGESGPALVIGKATESLLLQRIKSGEMPPGDKKLSPAEIGLIETWINQGARTQRDEPESLKADFLSSEERNFWAFQPVSRPPLPSVTRPELVNSPIDRFLLYRLEQENLSYSAPTTKIVLIRRLCFNLLGLPPTPEQVQTFLNDSSPDAYERLVDRLLASPHYGERWGRHWLDIAGYADSEGYTEKDPVREFAYFYRDYVIGSMNQDKPFDEFIVEQLAGDELIASKFQNMTAEQREKITATGFLRMAADGTASGGVDRAVASNEVMADTIKIVSSSLLGLTVGCARCHNHRYDPISQTDYHRLRAIFEPALDWKQWKTPNQRRISLYTEENRQQAASIEQQAQQVDKEREKVVQGHLDRTLLEELLMVPENLREPLKAAFQATTKERTKEQVELLDEYPNVGKITSGSLYLYNRKRSQRAAGIEKLAQQKEEGHLQRVRQAQLALVPATEQEAIITALAVTAKERSEDQRKLLDKFPGPAVTSETLKNFDPQAAAEIDHYRQVAKTVRVTDSEKELKTFSNKAKEIRGTIPKEHFIRALTEPNDHAPPTFLFSRGNHQQPASQVDPGELSVLNLHQPVKIRANDSELTSTGRRLAYARHLTSGKHPLVARVIVNRLWLHHFGRGIVSSAGDFGELGERPSHPHLLDWLADELVSHGWQLKPLHRMILTSQAFRQSSQRTARLDEIDPENRLYARASVRRIESEAVRDAILFVSGNLSQKMYGPPVPVMEDAVGQIVVGIEFLDGERKPTKVIPLNGEQFRRSLYIQVRRSRPLAVLETFDLATVSPNCTQRNFSNVAPQALLLMNSQFILNYARQFADRVTRETGKDLATQLNHAWELAYGTQPTEENSKLLQAYVLNQEAVFRKQDSKMDQATARQQALASACQAMLSANAFIYID